MRFKKRAALEQERTGLGLLSRLPMPMISNCVMIAGSKIPGRLPTWHAQRWSLITLNGTELLQRSSSAVLASGRRSAREQSCEASIFQYHVAKNLRFWDRVVAEKAHYCEFWPG